MDKFIVYVTEYGFKTDVLIETEDFDDAMEAFDNYVEKNFEELLYKPHINIILKHNGRITAKYRAELKATVNNDDPKIYIQS